MDDLWNQHKSHIVGVWKLISYDIFDSDGPDKKLIGKPHGDNPEGRAVITPGAFLSGHLMTPDRIQTATQISTASDEEAAYIARGISMYCGNFKFCEGGNNELWWETKVKIASDPSRIGGLQVRKLQYFEEEGKSFMLLTPKQDMPYGVSFRCVSSFI